MSQPQWSHLPPELLEAIARKNDDIIDYARFRKVCPSWRSAAMAAADFPSSPLPWLMLPYDPRTGIRSFFSPGSNRVHTIDLPEARNKHALAGSSHGWLVTLEPTTLSLSLLNPLTGAQIQLPPITPIPWVAALSPFLRRGERTYWAFRNVTLSSNPSASPDDCVVTLTDSAKRLSFCRLGDHSWTFADPSDLPFSSIASVVYCKGLLYVMGARGDCAVLGRNGRASRASIPPPQRWSSWLATLDLHMVSESSDDDELLLIARSQLIGRGYFFDTFKLDISGGVELKWSKVGSIGDRSLFYTPTAPLSPLCARVVAPGSSICKPDRLYFDNRSAFDPDGVYFVKVFDINESTYQSPLSCEWNWGSVNRVGVWITPSLF